MAYRDDVTALSPDHLWRFDADSNDSVGTLNGTDTGISTAAAITEDATNSRESNAVTDRIALATSADVDQTLTRKAIGGWLRFNSVQAPPKSLYREGTTNSQFCFVVWAGNACMLDIVNSGTIDQLFSNRTLAANRIFHVFAVIEGTGFGDKIELYLDGILQDSDTLGAVSLASRAVGEWADPSSTTEVGNQTVLLNGPTSCRYAYWASWGDTTLPTATEIREELFEKGVLASQTIATDSEANMQTSLNAFSDTVRGDEPLNIRVNDVSGGGTLNLTADNITHDPLASIHVQWMGTGTLNWTNTNGANASIGSTPNGGTLNFINPATLTVSPLIANSEVRYYEAGTTTEIAGIESSGTSFASSVSVNSVDIVVHKEDYEYVRVTGVDTSGGDVSVPISQVFDRNYENG